MRTRLSTKFGCFKLPSTFSELPFFLKWRVRRKKKNIQLVLKITLRKECLSHSPMSPSQPTIALAAEALLRRTHFLSQEKKKKIQSSSGSRSGSKLEHYRKKRSKPLFQSLANDLLSLPLSRPQTQSP